MMREVREEALACSRLQCCSIIVQWITTESKVNEVEYAVDPEWEFGALATHCATELRDTLTTANNIVEHNGNCK
jgi:hypothetical protein